MIAFLLRSQESHDILDCFYADKHSKQSETCPIPVQTEVVNERWQDSSILFSSPQAYVQRGRERRRRRMKEYMREEEGTEKEMEGNGRIIDTMLNRERTRESSY